jgi:hypothetical protein
MCFHPQAKLNAQLIDASKNFDVQGARVEPFLTGDGKFMLAANFLEGRGFCLPLSPTLHGMQEKQRISASLSVVMKLMKKSGAIKASVPQVKHSHSLEEVVSWYRGCVSNVA